MKVTVCIPTLNAASLLTSLCSGLAAQIGTPFSVLLMDSSSSDDTVGWANQLGASIFTIPRSTFNHGGTRQLAVEWLPDTDIIVFMTQDAVLANEFAIENLVRAFDDPQVAMAYGRQLPHVDAKPLGAHARLFNYPDKSYVATLPDREQMGIKAAFSSNSFAAYRRSALMAVGGFPRDIILGEDTFVAAKVLLAGWKVAYQADALVYHSHDYSMCQEFRRYFDIGVFHHREHWLLDAFGKPEGEGGRFVRSEIVYLFQHAPWLIPSALLRTGLKYLGYRLGRTERLLPLGLKRLLSMHRGFWRG
jgi:rhamnosyltransferase